MSDDRERLPWLPWWVDDEARVTLGWPPLARLAYRELVDHQWRTGAPVESDDVRMLVVGITPAQWRIVWPHIDRAFPIVDEVQRVSPRLELLRKHQTRKHAELSAAGKRGAKVRWGKWSR